MQHPTAHLVIDMVNPLDFPGAERMLPTALAAARSIAELRRRLREAGIPTVFVNDNFGHWNMSFREIADLCRDRRVPGSALLDILPPEDDDYFILKPRHSAFYCTSLDALLGCWETRRVILTGIAANICVFYTAADAYMRQLELVVPADCTASEEPGFTTWALEQMRVVLKADTRPSSHWANAALEAETTDAPAQGDRPFAS